MVWTIPSPFVTSGLGAARLVSTPSRKYFRAWLGIALSGFPDFEQFYSASFPAGTQLLKSAVSADFTNVMSKLWPNTYVMCKFMRKFCNLASIGPRVI